MPYRDTLLGTEQCGALWGCLLVPKGERRLL